MSHVYFGLDFKKWIGWKNGPKQKQKWFFNGNS